LGRNIYCTFSISLSNSTYLWEVLSKNCGPGHWRVAIDPSGIVASSHTLIAKNQNIVKQYILSSGYSTTGIDINLHPTGI